MNIPPTPAAPRIFPAIRIFLHVGAGLEQHTWAKSFDKAKQAISAMMEAAGKEHTGLQDHRTVTFPEFMTTEVKATRLVFAEFHGVASDVSTTFSVATFNHAVLNAMLNSFIDLGLAKELAVCLHRAAEKPGFTLHTLDDELLLNDWPYGILDSMLEEHDLNQLGFTLPKRLQAAQAA